MYVYIKFNTNNGQWRWLNKRLCLLLLDIVSFAIEWVGTNEQNQEKYFLEIVSIFTFSNSNFFLFRIYTKFLKLYVNSGWYMCIATVIVCTDYFINSFKMSSNIFLKFWTHWMLPVALFWFCCCIFSHLRTLVLESVFMDYLSIYVSMY